MHLSSKRADIPAVAEERSSATRCLNSEHELIASRNVAKNIPYFGPEQAGVEAEFFTRVAFFDFLEVPEREAILRNRLAYLQRGLEYLHSLQQMADEGENCVNTVPSRSYAQRVLAFHTRRLHDEYEWTAAWLEEMQANK